ncbi:MAG: hypothetical protein OXH84_09240 [Gammaproteobacteria bacterium]|nr:hypothetical protein [Gammaproteobacteria bacterium]
MQILKIECYTFLVPFKFVFRHASATRSETENFLVRVSTTTGTVGFGEGCPRYYVTGETINSCRRFITEYQESFRAEVNCVNSLFQWIKDHDELIDANPSAFSALEVATLDVLGKHTSMPTEKLLGIAQENFTLNYSAIIGNSSSSTYHSLAKKYLSHGFTDFKIKLSGIVQDDQDKLEVWTQKSLTNSIKVRLDANNYWSNARECIAYLKQLPAVFWAIEEPLRPRDFEGMFEVSEVLQTKIILDESCITTEDLRSLSGNQWLCNVRVSKHGGIYRALELIAEIKKKKFEFILGAHVGETSLLSRATVLLTQSVQNSQRALEGAFGTHLLSHDLTDPEIKFNDRGLIELRDLQCLSQPGFGMEVKADLLRQL